MKKKEMIRVIQVAEAKAWKQYSLNKELYGADDEITKTSRIKWTCLFDLRQQLDIWPHTEEPQ